MQIDTKKYITLIGNLQNLKVKNEQLLESNVELEIRLGIALSKKHTDKAVIKSLEFKTKELELLIAYRKKELADLEALATV